MVEDVALDYLFQCVLIDLCPQCSDHLDPLSNYLSVQIGFKAIQFGEELDCALNIGFVDLV